MSNYFTLIRLIPSVIEIKRTSLKISSEVTLVIRTTLGNTNLAD
jgi:hypothetical protein